MMRTPGLMVPPRLAALVAIVSVCAGCSEELHPVAMPTTRVRGEVTEDHRPVSGGWIEFVPVDGTVGNLRSARLGPDGRFDSDGVAVGTNLIRLVNARIGTRPYRGIFSTFTSTIRRDVGGSTPATIRIDLVEETIKFQEDRSRSASGSPASAGDAP